MSTRRPRLALPFTILTAPDTVRLVAGEDFRYTLTQPGLESWLPGWLAGLDGRTPLSEALGRIDGSRRAAAAQMVDRLYGERVLIDGTADEAHTGECWRLAIEGDAGWAVDWRPGGAEKCTQALPVLCQDGLDPEEALRFNRRCRASCTPWLWASTGAMTRAYVSPLFLPDAGPCLGCLLRHFRRLSPVPELYDALASHAREGRAIVPVPFPEPAAAIVRQLVVWKGELARETQAPRALYRLHVLEVESLEISSHRVLVDPECPECGR